MKRVFLVCLLGEKPWIYGEVLHYDRSTYKMLIRMKDGGEQVRMFNRTGSTPERITNSTS
jgi:hypothetical protein